MIHEGPSQMQWQVGIRKYVPKEVYLLSTLTQFYIIQKVTNTVEWQCQINSAYVSIITSKTFQFKKPEYCHNLNDESRKYFYHVVNFQTRHVATKARCTAWKGPWANCLHAQFSISQLIITEKPLLCKRKREGTLHSHNIRISQEEDRCQ